MLRQDIVDFVVTWHGLLLSGCRVVVDVVATAVPQKNAALLLNLADQLAALHNAISFVL